MLLHSVKRLKYGFGDQVETKTRLVGRADETTSVAVVQEASSDNHCQCKRSGRFAAPLAQLRHAFNKQRVLRPPARRATRHLFRRTHSEHRETAAQPHAVEK